MWPLRRGGPTQLDPALTCPSLSEFSLVREYEAVFNVAMFKSLPAQPGSVARHSRRDFIRHLSAAVAVGTAMMPIAPRLVAENARSAAKKTLVGSNIYGWGQYAQRDKKPLDVEEVMSALRDAGYDYLESYHERRSAGGDRQVR